MRGTYVSLASADIAERLAGSVAGTALPFSFNPELVLIGDRFLLENDVLYFNAARFDRSLALKMSDYVALSKPRLERIAKDRGTLQELPLILGDGSTQSGITITAQAR